MRPAVLALPAGASGGQRVSRRQDPGDWLARSPLAEIVFDGERLRAASPPRAG